MRGSQGCRSGQGGSKRTPKAPPGLGIQLSSMAFLRASLTAFLLAVASAEGTNGTATASSKTELPVNATNAKAVDPVPPIADKTEASTAGLKVKRGGQSQGPDVVRILHISDTHSLHRSTGNLPDADILIHSGDVAKVGSESELGDFNDWLGSLKGKYKHILVISGNHDFWDTNWRLNRGHISNEVAQDPAYFQHRITNARVLNHDLAEVMGLKIWGAGWHPRRGDSRSGNNYADIPEGVDIVVTHEAPFGIFDMTGGGHWGSSTALLDAIYRTKPKVHLFGHIHEQRGHWTKAGSQYQGGVEYRPSPYSGQVFRPNGPPPQHYPVEVESNNAMANQPSVDHSWTGVWAPQHIVGRPRAIIARRQPDGWHFASEA
ncbi:Metallophosphoesterase domain-containing protein 1 [Symbiodinium microadriaticum]|uniref:Metallophosphoesterase domain-containing protein 1 n=1 Tax=Symbiodinium microadriaticum TaxID=2951 RepID=A0A1Q9C2A9_SYMMI|nr:Metallophosphoesterase domain-containing protein 1 [Symbiodinium microadriaticum]